MSSKKKKRREAFLARQKKREIAKMKEAARRKALQSGDIEIMAKALGIPLN